MSEVRKASGSHPDAPGDVPKPAGRGELDDLDLAIIDQLQRDGRRSFRAMARSLGAPEGTVRFRTKRLIDRGIITIMGFANPHRMGLEVLASVLLQIEPGKRETVVAALTSWPEVMYLSSCTGSADLYAQIVCRDHRHMYQLLGERLGGVEGVRGVETLIELEIHKTRYDYAAVARGITATSASSSPEG